MLLTIPSVLDKDQLQEVCQALAEADWSDGRGSAGYLSQKVKNNLQLPDGHVTGLSLSRLILQALDGHPVFTSAALPRKIVPPLFNRYIKGQFYGPHVDGAIRPVQGSALRIRTDISATLFLSDPDTYEGGELVVEDTYGSHSIKLQAGDMVIYPGSSVHQVMPVISGERLASFFWIESMVRQDYRRRVLFELDMAIQGLAGKSAESAELVKLAGVYHNLLREWSDS